MSPFKPWPPDLQRWKSPTRSLKLRSDAPTVDLTLPRYVRSIEPRAPPIDDWTRRSTWPPSVRSLPESSQSGKIVIGCVRCAMTGRATVSGPHYLSSALVSPYVIYDRTVHQRIRSQSDPASGHMINQSQARHLVFKNDRTHHPAFGHFNS